MLIVSGISNLVKDVQYANALIPICLTLLGNLMLVKEEQYANAASPISQILSESFKLLSWVHS